MRLATLDLSRLRLPGTAAAAAGALGSLLLHLAIFGAILLGPGAGRPPRHSSGLGAAALGTDNVPLGVLIMIDAPADAVHPTDPADALGSRGHLLSSPLLTIVSPKISLPDFDFLDPSPSDAASSEPTTGDQRGRAALFGLYLRQVRARIERAWQRPAQPTSGGGFTCRVQITQSQRGEVREVQLMSCTPDLPWRLSLVNAIDSASPLPAPPDPRVFADLLRLSFHAGAASSPAVPATSPTAGIPPQPASQGPRP